MNTLRDRSFLEMAYALAAKAVGRTSPNPCVGAVLVKNGAIVGHGHHEAAGRPHAEAVALRRAGSKARGATLYVTLEPCVHQGRTPPCADAVIKSGVVRVVVSDRDANPIVRGRGLARLRRAGIDVSWGLLAERNRRLNAAYIKFIASGIPYVTLKAAVGLDGKLATRTGESRWITSPAAREYGRLVRGEGDAVMVGIGTALGDDPLLDVRHPNWPDKKVTRIVLDARLRLSPLARLASEPSGGPILIFAGTGAEPRRKRALEKKGVEVVSLPAPQGRFDLREVLRVLGGRGITSVLVEGGGTLATSFLEARLADRGLFVIAPLLIGGRAAVSLFAGEGPASLADALRLGETTSFRLGGDTIIEGVF
jgi:diaminohydroxyphosphoribosylaminopyrimidine deaminase/5-amino-6-(5-phosphoribosylamino)uracil reductase